MSEEQVLFLAEKYNISEEVKFALENGQTPEQIFDEWDF